MKTPLPRILIIDDLFGRSLPDRLNADRQSFCLKYRLRDVTGDEVNFQPDVFPDPQAEAVFCRGQIPACAVCGNRVENDLEGTLALIAGGWTGASPERRWALVLLDLCFHTGEVTAPDGHSNSGIPAGRDSDWDSRSYFGLALLAQIKRRFPGLPTVIFSGREREPIERQFSTDDALGFIERDTDFHSLKAVLCRHGLIADPTGAIIGHSLRILEALRAARRAAMSDRDVLVLGERGTGKELIADYIHAYGEKRRSHPLIKIDCGAIPDQLYQSELFGHQKGAFTGATSDQTGRFTHANFGHLFLDEFANMPAMVQEGVLRAVGEREVLPMGSAKAIKVDVRFIAATNENIHADTSANAFRKDLIDRLAGQVIRLPPVRERPEDIPSLAEFFLNRSRVLQNKHFPSQIAPETMEALKRYSWPGNVRELHSCIANAVANSDVDFIMPQHLTLEGAKFPISSGPVSISVSMPEPNPPRVCGADLEGLLQGLEKHEFLESEIAEWSGSLPRIQRVFAQFLARCLKAGIQATKKPTPENPGGDLKIHPALKLLTGNNELTGSQAADLVKKIVTSKGVEPMLEDATLKWARDKAVSLRPKGKKRTDDVPV